MNSKTPTTNFYINKSEYSIRVIILYLMVDLSIKVFPIDYLREKLGYNKP